LNIFHNIKVKKINVALIRRLKTFKIDTDTNGNGSTESNQAVLPLKFSRKTLTEKVYNYKKEDVNSGSIINYLKVNGSWLEENVTKKFPHKSYSTWSGVRPSEKRSILIDFDIPVYIFNLSFEIILTNLNRRQMSERYNMVNWLTCHILFKYPLFLKTRILLSLKYQ
jgi:hypothetical protein